VLTVAARGPLRRLSRKAVVRWALGTLAVVGPALVGAGIAAATDSYLDPRRYQ
jgi:hypothetical protein